MKIYINKDGFLQSANISDANIELEVSEDTWDLISCCKIGYNWKYENNEWKQVFINKLENFRRLRYRECFNIIDNKSVLWYNSLSSDQLKELTDWYNAWLNVTETEIIPEKPVWLK